MTTVLSNTANEERHNLKVSVLDTIAVSLDASIYYSGSLQLAALSPSFRAATDDKTLEAFLEKANDGSNIKEIFQVLGIFDEFELEYLSKSFETSDAAKAVRTLANHLRDYYVISSVR